MNDVLSGAVHGGADLWWNVRVPDSREDTERSRQCDPAAVYEDGRRRQPHR